MPCCFISNLETELHRCSVQLDVPRKTLLSVIICKAMGGVRLTVVTFPCCVQHQHFGNSDTFNACWVIRWLQNPSNSDMDYGKRVGSTEQERSLSKTFNACWVIWWLQNPSNSDMDYGKRIGSTYRARALTLKSQVMHNQAWSPHGWVLGYVPALRFLQSQILSRLKKKSFKWDYELRSAMCIYMHEKKTP